MTKKTHGFGCAAKEVHFITEADMSEGGDAIWSAFWLITSAGLLRLFLLLESSSVCLQLALLPSCRFKVTIPPVVYLKFLPQVPVGEFLQFRAARLSSNLFYGHFLVISFTIEWFVAMVPKVAPAIPCGAADLPLPFVQCWYWHLINLGALLPEKHIADDDFRASFFMLEWQMYIPAGNSIVSHTLYLCMHGPNAHS